MYNRINKEKYPEAINEMIALLKTLPGVGGRSAARMAFTILKWKPEKQKALGALITDLEDSISNCSECGNISEKDKKCIFCTDPSRKSSIICVVEEVTNIPSIEASALFKGLYHVLGGRIAPLEGRNVEDLNISSLVKRVQDHNVSEIILALAQDVEGQATSIYISDLFKDMDIKITRLARGLPVGSDIAYADSATIAAAFNGRIYLNS